MNLRSPEKEFRHYLGRPRNDMWEYMEFLLEVARQCTTILEIGVRGGVSTAVLLYGLQQRGGHLWSVDRDENCGELYRHYPGWTFIAADSRDVSIVRPRLPAALDALFVDGGHDFDTCWADLENYGPLVRAGGWILMHDVYPIDHQRWEHGVPQAYERYLGETGFAGQILPGRYGLAVIRKEAAHV